MKIKLNKLENIIVGMERMGDKRFPIKLQYAIAKNKKNMIEEYKNLLNQKRELFERDCIKDKNGNPVLNGNQEYQYETEDIKGKVLEEYRELLDTDVEIETMMISMDVLEKCDTEGFDSLTGHDMDTLNYFVNE